MGYRWRCNSERWSDSGQRPPSEHRSAVGEIHQSSHLSYSMVLDVGEWDNSLALNSPGQSGDPASPHYRDLHARWLTGEMFPLLFSRHKIEPFTETRLWLRPQENESSLKN